MTVIIGIAGKKGSGKNTIANFLHGHILKLNEVIEKFEITENGELLVNTHYIKDGVLKEDMGVLDLLQQNDMYLQYADQMIWPYVKLYHFADPLKELCCTLFNMTQDQVYGNRKNTLTKLKWQDMPGVITPEIVESAGINNDIAEKLGLSVHKLGYMSAREAMQFVGTEIFRKINNNIWANTAIERIKNDSPLVAIIADCRFDNEANKIKEAGGILIHLNRTTEEDSHSSENGFEKANFDLYLDNANMSIQESCNNVLAFLQEKNIKPFINKAE